MRVIGLPFVAALVGSRVGIRDLELRIPAMRRVSQIAVQSLALLPAVMLLKARLPNSIGAGMTAWTSLVLSLLMWTSTAAATRVARGAGVPFFGPGLALWVVLGFPIFEAELRGVAWEAETAARWSALTPLALLFSLWPRRIPANLRVSRRAVAVIAAFLACDNARALLAALEADSMGSALPHRFPDDTDISEDSGRGW